MPDRIRVQLVSDDSRAKEIAELYWEQDEEGAFINRVAEIAEAYALSSREVRGLVNEAAIAESASRLCSVCGSGRRVLSRSDALSTSGPVGHFVCEECRTQEIADRREAERKLIAEQYVVPDEAPFLDASLMSLEEAVGLYALIRQCADEAHERLLPVRAASQPIAPFDYVFDILRLLHGNVLFVDPTSDSDAFVWETGAPDSFYLERVRWRVPGQGDELKSIAVQLRQVFSDRAWPSRWVDEAPQLQSRIAAQELAGYLTARLDEHHFSFSPGPKTWEVLNAMARSRPIGCGYNLIWRAARDAAAFSVRERCSSKRAGSYAIGVLRRAFEKAEAQNWSIKPFARDWNLPRSEVTHVFYELFLGVSDEMVCAPLYQEDLSAPF